MSEPTPEFRERALSAAGPVFLVTLGLVLLVTLAVLVLFASPPAPLAWTWGISGFVALAGGLAWGAASRDRPAGHRTP